MKTTPVVLLSLTAFFAAAETAAAQQTTDRFLTTISVKVAPGKEDAFTEFYKTGAGSKSIRARQQANPRAVRWTLLRLVYPGDPAPEANFLISTVRMGAPSDSDEAQRDEATRASTGMSYADYMKTVRTMSDPVGSTLSHVHESTDGYALAAGDYAVVRRIKVTQGKLNELSSFNRGSRLALANEGVKSGAMKGWVFMHQSFPTGASLPFDAVEASIYKDLASALSAQGPAASAQAAARFAKAVPSQSYAAYIDKMRELSRVVRTDLYRVVVTYSR